VEKQEKEERIIDHRKKVYKFQSIGMKEERIIEIYHRKKIANF
jgi:hypothetical protein